MIPPADDVLGSLVLVVSADPLARLIASSRLVHAGYRVIEASDVSASWWWSSSETFVRVVILDPESLKLECEGVEATIAQSAGYIGWVVLSKEHCSGCAAPSPTRRYLAGRYNGGDMVDAVDGVVDEVMSERPVVVH